MKNLKLDIAGLTCSSCVRGVEVALAQLDDVVVKRIDRSGVDLALDDDVEADDVIKAINEASVGASS